MNGPGQRRVDDVRVTQHPDPLVDLYVRYAAAAARLDAVAPQAGPAERAAAWESYVRARDVYWSRRRASGLVDLPA